MPRPIKTKTFSAPALSRFSISHFRGVDLSSSPNNVDKTRSPDAPNMISDLDGFPVKRPGYETVTTYGGRINGVHFLRLPDGVKKLIHAGDTLYLGETALYTGMNDHISKSQQAGGKLWILDGKQYLCFDGETVKPASEVAYTPTLTISRKPTGGGESYEPLNLLSAKFTDSFLGEADVRDYQLSLTGLDAAKVTARVLKADGSWQEMTEGSGFTVNRPAGKVSFTTAPGVSPVTGRDNVQITASKARADDLAKVNGCDVPILFGVNGASDRLFVTGNPDYPNQDWYSQKDDPSYFGDTWYSILGQDSSAIVGYSIVGGRLAAHKDATEDGRNIIVRQGSMMDGKAAFPIVSALQGEGAVGKNTFAYFSTEPLFLTRLGIYAVTAQDITGEKYSQNRSFYLNAALTSEPNLASAYGIAWRDYYLLALNNKIYILDGKQRSYERDAPYATFQYECYYWTNVPARVLWEEDETLYFGTADGKVCRFKEDRESLTTYNDDGAAIEAYWTIPSFSGKEFYKKKTVRYLAVKVAPAIATSIRIWVQKKGIWSLLFEEFGRTRYFSWTQLCWSKFSWSSDTTPRTVGRKVKIKKIDQASFRLENREKDEPFGIYEFSLEFTEIGNYKG